MERKRKDNDIRDFFSVKKAQTNPTMEKQINRNEDEATILTCEKCSTEVKIFDKSFHDAFDCPPKSKDSKPTAAVLQDGLVLFRNWLTAEQQQHTIDFCIKLGNETWVTCNSAGEGRVDSKYSFFKTEVPEGPYSPKELLAEEKKTKAFCQSPYETFDKDVVQLFKYF